MDKIPLLSLVTPANWHFIAISCLVRCLSICSADKHFNRNREREKREWRKHWMTESERMNLNQSLIHSLTLHWYSTRIKLNVCVSHAHAQVNWLSCHYNLRIDIVCGKCSVYECVAGMLFFVSSTYAIPFTHGHTYQHARPLLSSVCSWVLACVW